MHLFILLAIPAISLSMAQAFTLNSLEDFDEWPRSPVGTPGTKAGLNDKCKKDLLIVLDVSYSIGRHTFDNKIKPFLKKLVANSQLNVDPTGTQIAMMIFSETDKTKMLFNFGDKPSQTDLVTYMLSKSFTWDKLKGGRTRTGLALHKVNRDVFTKSSPANARPNIPDVVMMITDGEPRGPSGEKNETSFAYDEAQTLRDKDVLIIGIAMGSQKDKFKPVIQKITGSYKNTFDTDFDKLDTILDKLVDASCKPFKPGDCNCADIRAADFFVPPGQTTKLITWTEPKLECNKDKKTQNVPLIISPYIKSPHSFAIGHHQVTYSYKFNNFYANCTVEFNISTCDCTSPVNQHTYYVKPDNPTRSVSWTVPQPSCSGVPINHTTFAPFPPGYSFPIGQYTVLSTHHMKPGFAVTCAVDIEVKIIPCQGRDYDPNQQVCCCGKLWSKKPGWKCCGKKFYDASQLKCCPLFYNIVSNSQSCPGDDITA